MDIDYYAELVSFLYSLTNQLFEAEEKASTKKARDRLAAMQSVLARVIKEANKIHDTFECEAPSPRFEVEDPEDD